MCIFIIVLLYVLLSNNALKEYTCEELRFVSLTLYLSDLLEKVTTSAAGSY